MFAGDLEEADWEHALGGMHALAYDGDVLVAHASVIQRRLIHDGRALRTGYVECVGVAEHVRRRGYGAMVMAAAEHVIRGAYDLGALGSTDMAMPFYASRGWKRWQGETFALTPDGIRRTADADDAIHVLEVGTEVDVNGALTCDWRGGDVW